MTAKKRATKSPTKSPTRKPKHGNGALRVGNLGNKGGTGRPPDEFRERCRLTASREEVFTLVETILTDGTHPNFLGALKYAAEHGYGKPKQAVEHSADAETLEALVAAARRGPAPE